jgi:aminopeptidase N
MATLLLTGFSATVPGSRPSSTALAAPVKSVATPLATPLATLQPAIGWPSPPSGEAPVISHADLITLENPQRTAFVNHQVAVRLDPATHSLAAEDRILVRRAPDIAASEPVSFLLWDSLRVESVRLPDGTALRYEVRERMNPRSFWKRPPYDRLDGYARTRQVDLFLDGSGTGSQAADLSIVVRYAGTVMDSLRPPKAAYSRSFEETAGLIEARGVYLCGSSFWIPSRPDEVFNFRCDAEVPEGWRAVSQGALAGSGPARAGSGPAPAAAGRWTRDSWDCAQPMEEIYLVAGPYALHQRDHRGTAVMTFTYAATDSALYTRYLDGTGRYLDLYEERIGRYPFPKFALVENFWQTGFGMPSFTLLGDRVIRLPFILDTSYGHEILHNWWGNGVFVDAATGNWCEGLTTYGADYFYKEREGPDAARDYRRNALVSYLDYVSGATDIPLAEFTGRSDAATQAIGYSKSMMVVHQLRRAVGPERFQAALRDFFARNLWRRASWTDLLESFRTVAGIEPRPFRAQWIERPGWPFLAVDRVSAKKEGKAWRVRATLRQSGFETGASGASAGARTGTGTGTGTVGNASGDAAGGSPYNLVVPVRVSFAGGDSTWQLPLTAASLEWSALVPAKPARLAVDPDFEVARRIDRHEIPPSLSRTLGVDTVAVVIASGLSPEIDAACRALAAEWGKGQVLTVYEEGALANGWTPRHAAWYLGLGPAARLLVAGLPEVRVTDRVGAGRGGSGSRAAGGTGTSGFSTWTIAGVACPDTCSVVVTGDYPGGGEASWTVIAPSDPASLAAIGVKVPHYGKYGYLVFRGASVVQKGSWAEIPSPLVVDLAKEEK